MFTFSIWIDRFTDWSRLRYWLIDWLIDWLIAYRAVNPPWVHEAATPVHQLPAQVRRYFRGNRPRMRRQSIRHVSCQQYGRGFKCCLLLPQVQYSLFTFTSGAVHFVCFYPRCGTLCLLLPQMQYTLFTFIQGVVHFVYFYPRCSTLRLFYPRWSRLCLLYPRCSTLCLLYPRWSTLCLRLPRCSTLCLHTPQVQYTL